jgi:hypothetical protein
MDLLLTAILCSVPASPWDATPTPTKAPRTGAATTSQRQEALEDVAKALQRWPHEKGEFNRDVDELRRWLERPPDLIEKPGVPEPEVVRKPGAKSTRYGKIIEVPPDTPPAPKSWVDEEAGHLEQREEDPKAYAREQARRAFIREGNRQWDEAVAKRRAEQAIAIEAEAAKMQRALEAARRKEAELNARKMGGSLDADGNFVDPDLEEKKK